MYRLLVFCFLIGYIFSNSIVGKYSASTDGGYYTHFLEFYSNGTYTSKIFGETAWGDWIQSGDYVKLYHSGFKLDDIYLSNNSFYFGGIEFIKVEHTPSNDTYANLSPVGIWTGLVNSLYGETFFKITFYSDGSYFESFAGNTTYGDWQFKNDKIILIDSSGMPSWSAIVYNDKIKLTSSSPYVNTFTIELSKK